MNEAGLLHMVYAASNSNMELEHISTTDGTNWSAPATTGLTMHSTQAGPTLTAYNGALRLSYVASNSSNLALRMSSVDGVHWGTESAW